jgi:hypothetical protein
MMNQQIAEAILNFEDYEEEEFFEEVSELEITGTSRWNTFYSKVFQDTRDNTYWEITWSRGSTEIQDNGAEDIEFRQVKPVNVTVIKYLPLTDFVAGEEDGE